MRLQLNLTQFKLYLVSNTHYLLCAVRRKLIVAHPEELVRQAIVKELVKSGVDENLIELEVPLSKFKKRAQGRVDIVVYQNFDFDGVALIIECKAKEIPLTNEVLEQVVRYNKATDCGYVCTTNGIDFFAYKKLDETYQQLNLFKLQELLDTDVVLDAKEDFPWQRSQARDFYNLDYLKEFSNYYTEAPTYPISRYMIDFESSNQVKSLSIRLLDLLYDVSHKNSLKSLCCKLASLDSDLGERFSRYTYFGGEGSFSEFYRHLLLQSSLNNDFFTVSTALYSYDYYNHSKEENHISSHRGTYLMFGFNYRGNSNHSLEYKLDRHVSLDSIGAHFWHDGSITVVKRQKNSDMIERVKHYAPHLVKNGKIYLGTLSSNGPLYMSDDEVRNLLSNFIDYILVRELFRAEIRGTVFM